MRLLFLYLSGVFTIEDEESDSFVLSNEDGDDEDFSLPSPELTLRVALPSSSSSFVSSSLAASSLEKNDHAREEDRKKRISFLHENSAEKSVSCLLGGSDLRPGETEEDHSLQINIHQRSRSPETSLTPLVISSSSSCTLAPEKNKAKESLLPGKKAAEEVEKAARVSLDSRVKKPSVEKRAEEEERERSPVESSKMTSDRGPLSPERQKEEEEKKEKKRTDCSWVDEDKARKQDCRSVQNESCRDRSLFSSSSPSSSSHSRSWTFTRRPVDHKAACSSLDDSRLSSFSSSSSTYLSAHHRGPPMAWYICLPFIPRLCSMCTCCMSTPILTSKRAYGPRLTRWRLGVVFARVS